MNLFSRLTVKIYQRLFRYTLLGLLVSLSLATWAQVDTTKRQSQRVQIKQADFIKNLMIDSITIDRLIGEVILEHNGATMSCDSAYVFPDSQFEAYGNVVVTSKRATVTGDEMRYDGNTNMAEVRGEIVYLADSTSTLRTTAIDFNTKDEIGYFEYQGTLADSTRLLECQKGYYYAKRKEFEFIGRVQSRTADYTLQSDSLKYNTETKRFDFYRKTHIWAKDSYFYTDNGWYNSETSELYFRKNSYILSKTQEIFADSIYYEDLFKTGQLYQNIQLLDTVQRSMAMADWADFNMKTQDFEMRKNPSVLFYEEKSVQDTLSQAQQAPNSLKLDSIATTKSQNDTIYMRAEIIRSINLPRLRDTAQVQTPVIDSGLISSKTVRIAPADSLKISETIAPPQLIDSVKPPAVATEPADTTYRQIWGIHKVKIFRHDFQAISDSMYFNTIDSIWRMYKSPQLWNAEKMQLSADSVFMNIKNGQMYKGDLLSNAMIVMPENSTDTSKFFNQIKGKNMYAYFKDNDMYRLNALGNIQTLFFSTPDQAINTTESALLDIYFTNRKIRRVVYRNKITAENKPLNMVTEEQTKLAGFAWNKDMRPKNKEEILQRTLRPSERQVRQAIPFPKFPITERFDLLGNVKK